ncbi:heparan-alpha-glucosaminide N-acetyltransferase domain-containing protein [Mobilicoccus pelagius]|uniref:Heparan-alpha-glucosaminide N-acetyltransferase catalytic domain-containing protein n=1 Tax=Mobilicoccus pelagius NBRC 104925 TaxID=1089455 RepID=H5UMZ7_9MICO|nr:hypothetical protein MOPEL_003_01300 [Mobilicoccus pelagius NBRC 104925]
MSAAGSGRGGRLESLDVCRGVMLVVSVVVNAWFTAPEWFEHAAWTGVHPVDLVFPAFVTLSGAGMAIAFARRVPVARQVRRVLVLTAAGLAFAVAGQVLGTGAVDVATLRFTGVLQLYAFLVLALGLVAVVVRRWWHWLAAAAVVAGAQAWLLASWASSCPGGALTKACNPSGVVDAAVFGPHMYVMGRLGHDPEGFVAAAGALVTALVGAAAGRLMWEHRRGMGAAVFGRAVLVVGVATVVVVRASVVVVEPFKRLWTVPFGWGIGGAVAVTLLVVHVLLDGRVAPLGERVARYPLIALGRNSLLVAASVPTQRQRDGEVAHHFRRIVPGHRPTPRPQRLTQCRTQARDPHRARQQRPSRVRHRRHPRGVDSDTRVQPATLTHLRSALRILRISTSAIDILAGQGHFSRTGVTHPREISGLGVSVSSSAWSRSGRRRR